MINGRCLRATGGHRLIFLEQMSCHRSGIGAADMVFRLDFL